MKNYYFTRPNDPQSLLYGNWENLDKVSLAGFISLDFIGLTAEKMAGILNAVKDVIEASSGTDESAMDEAIDKLKEFST